MSENSIPLSTDTIAPVKLAPMPDDPYKRIALFYDWLFESGARGLSEVTVGLANLPAEARVLDVGCGTGILLEVCVERGFRAHGVDPSDGMLEVARRRLGASAQLRTGDGQHLPFGDGELDAVFATMVLHELDPVTRANTLAEMIRVTRHDGVLAIADYHNGRLHGLWGWARRGLNLCAEMAAGRAHFAGYRHFMGNGSLGGLLVGAPVVIAEQKVVAGGTLAVHILRRT